jgi:hypothetical protein
VEEEKCIKNYGWKPDRKRSLRRHRCSWEDTFNLYLGKTGSEGADWMHLAQDRDQWWALVNMVMSLHVP